MMFSGYLHIGVNSYVYLSHPQVLVDPNKDVPKWSLNEIGHKRVAQLVKRIKDDGILSKTKYVISSEETKAIETAQPIANILACKFITCPLMHENDRSATGFLTPDEFEKVADQFFAHPDISTRGWETARDAQTRILKQVNQYLNVGDHEDILFVGHGGVGTLLFCALANKEISRIHDQGAANGGNNVAAGGGNYFAFDVTTQKAIHSWQAMEDIL